MAITNRNNHLVLGKRAILVRDVTDSVANRKSMDWIMQRFPIEESEVWECIDAVADLDLLTSGVHLKVRNTSDDKQDIIIEVAQISDTFFIKTLQYGKIFLPKSNDFEQIFNVGLNRLALESYQDVVNGSISYQESDLHLLTYNAFNKELESVLSTDKVLELLKESDNEAQV